MIKKLGSGKILNRLQDLERENECLRNELASRELAFLSDYNDDFSFFNNLEQAITFIDSDYYIIQTNISSLRSSSYTPKNAIGQPCYRVFYGKEKPCKECRVKEVFKTKSACRFVKSEGVNGKVSYFEKFAKPLLNRRGDVEIVMLETREVTKYQTSFQIRQGKDNLYRQVFEHSGDIFLIHNTDGRLIEYSPKLLMMLGYSNEEMLSLRVQDINDESFSMSFYERMRSLDSSGSDVFEVHLVSKEGVSIPVEVNASLMDYGEGKACFVAIRDIRLRKMAERKLRESETRFRSLLENSPDLVMRFDRQYRHLYVNSASRPVLHREPHEFIGLTHEEMNFPAEKCKFWEDNMRKVFETAKPNNVEFSLLMDGEELFFEWRLIPEFTDDGQVETVLAVARDITKRKQAERELVESETRLKLAMDGASESLWDWNITQKRVECNDQWYSLLGYDKSKIPNLYIFISQIIHPDDSRRLLNSCYQHFNGKTELFEVEHRLLNSKGEYIWFLERGKVVEWSDDGKAVRALGTCVNINDLKVIQGKLHEANVTKDKFFSIIAHDLKNPFNALLGFSSLLKESGDSLGQEQVQECIDLIYSSAHQGYSLLENLLEWSRSQMGKILWNPEKISLKVLLDNNHVLHMAKAREKNIDLDIDICGNPHVFVDSYMIDTVLRNLISNALKFSYPGGVVKVIVAERDKYCDIEIQDSGIGISPENIKKLFRLDATYTRMGTQNEMGTGLGLILCKEFVTRNHGEIWVESQEGRGSRFIFSLPKASGE